MYGIRVSPSIFVSLTTLPLFSLICLFLGHLHFILLSYHFLLEVKEVPFSILGLHLFLCPHPVENFCYFFGLISTYSLKPNKYKAATQTSLSWVFISSCVLFQYHFFSLISTYTLAIYKYTAATQTSLP